MVSRVFIRAGSTNVAHLRCLKMMFICAAGFSKPADYKRCASPMLENDVYSCSGFLKTRLLQMLSISDANPAYFVGQNDSMS
ncbi:hypothetical protein DTQ70_29630 [Runella sp. SP2]|nr:hypothetical protein DTQ70_29630 [Runella sp. SP2]